MHNIFGNSIFDIEAKVQNLSPKPGDVILVSIPPETRFDFNQHQAVLNCLQQLSVRPQMEGVQVVLNADGYEWKNLNLKELRELRDKLNEAIYDKERQR